MKALTKHPELHARERTGDAVSDLVDWVRYAQPAWNSPGEVPSALRALANPNDLDRLRAYHRLLYALGNDHAGTYFPVVLPAIAALGEILRDGVLVARLRTPFLRSAR